MKTAIRVNGSSKIGLGHCMRCLTLADQLDNSHVVWLLNEDVPDSFIRLLDERHFHYHLLNEEEQSSIESDAETCQMLLQMYGIFDFLIVDHYGLGSEWERKLRPYVTKIMVIDDLGNRTHDCDILLDQNLASGLESKYKGLIPERATQLLGPQYALLRNEFHEHRKTQYLNRKHCEVVINFGGSDPTGECFKIIKAIELIGSGYVHYTIIAGPANTTFLELKENYKYLDQVTILAESNEMAKFYSEGDIAIGAGGISLMERMIIGIPSIVIAVAENQIESVVEADRLGICQYAGYYEDVSVEDITNIIRRFINDFDKRYAMHQVCKTLYQMNNNYIAEVITNEFFSNRE